MTREVCFQRTSAALLGFAAIAFTGDWAAASAEPILAPVVTSAVASAPLAIVGAQDVQRYVQAATLGAQIRNIPDPAGLLVAKVAGGTTLAVYQEKSGYMQVAVPGGYQVWVYGSLLKESGRPGWLELTGNQVNMRPEPRTKNSFPIGQLHKGDRVRFIQRADEQIPMKDDWIRVWSPSTAQAWVAVAETSAIPAGNDGAALFGAAAAGAAQTRSGGTTGTTGLTPASTTAADGTISATGTAAVAGTAGATKADAYTALAAAQELMRQAIASESMDFSNVRAAYAEVYLLEPNANTRRIVERDLEQVKLHEELIAARQQLDGQRQAIEAEQARQDAILREAKLRKDPLWGRFESRGWMTSEKVRGGEPRFVITYAGDRKQVIECSSGRYDLAQFVGYEIGIEGLLSGMNAAAELPTVDARSIEVISGRYQH